MIAEKVDVHYQIVYQIVRSISAEIAPSKTHHRSLVLAVGGFDLDSWGMGWKISVWGEDGER
jgi:hypothetical protein